MRLTVRNKLYGGFAVVLVLLIAVAVLGINGLGRVSTLSGTIYTDTTVPLADLGTARAKINESRALLSNHILESTPAERAKLEAKIAANAKITNTTLADVGKTLQTPESEPSSRGCRTRSRPTAPTASTC